MLLIAIPDNRETSILSRLHGSHIMEKESSGNKIIIDKDLEEIVPRYLQIVRNDMQVLRDAFEKKDYEALKRVGHKFKGSGGAYGFDVISEIGAKIEILAQSKQEEDIRPLIGQLCSYFETIEIVYE
jgi:HPt (histidine-containing phosphotransfer) domain-containing protein